MTQIEEELIIKAKEACEKAYAPYSEFPVGASVLTSGDEIFCGCNIENASYGLTVCAERNAIANALVDLGPQLKITKVVVYTPTKDITTPCGACRQVISEFSQKTEIIIVNKTDSIRRYLLDDLLPDSFSL